MKQVTNANHDRPIGGDGSTKRPIKRRSQAGPRLPDASREAKRIAASILEVLAGISSPSAAAASLNVSLPRYYLLEQRAVEALVKACEPRTGRTRSPLREVDSMRNQLERAQRDASRFQTLLRVAQRTIGLAPPAAQAAPKSKGAKAKRTRRPAARALVAARNLRDEATVAAPPNSTAPEHQPERPAAELSPENNHSGASMTNP